MIKAPFGIIGVAAAVLLTASFANISAQPAKAPAKDPACITLKDKTACGARTDCYWVAAVTDTQTGKEKRGAYCRIKRTTQKKK
jgi:hypothetical protein